MGAELVFVVYVQVHKLIFFPYLQTSLLLSWMLSGGNHRIPLVVRTSTSPDMTS